MDQRLMMNVSTARNLTAQAAAQGVKAPKSLAIAFAALDRAQEYAAEPGPDVNLQALTITADDVPALIAEIVDVRIRRQVTLEAADEVADRLARRVTRELIAFGPSIIDALAAPFNEAAETFTAAYRSLPSDYTPSRTTSETLARFETAQDAAVILSALATDRDTLAAMGVKAPGPNDVEPPTRYTVVATIQAAQRANRPGKHLHLGRWAALLDTRGVAALHWHTLDEQAALIASLDHEPAPQYITHSHGFKHSPIEVEGASA